MIIDAHLHLWENQNGRVNGNPVYSIGGGKSNFGGEIRQMMPPCMLDGRNTADILSSNMDYAGVSGCVVTQEYIDGNQDDYLLRAKETSKGRMKICSLYEENKNFRVDGFDGIKICAGRLSDRNLLSHAEVFKKAAEHKKFISIDLADGNLQTAALKELAQTYPDLKIAIGHFGMVTRDGWEEQIKLARLKNVFIESGGITWLYHTEYYPYPSAVRAILAAKELCGMEKLMWGSDYPRTMTAITYKMSFDFVQRTTEIPDADKNIFLGENAKKFYEFGEFTIPEKILNMVE